MGKKENKHIFMFDLDTYLEIVELAQKHGKKVGDSMQEEFEEILKKKKYKFKHLGTTNKDKDLLAGELREEGLRVLNLDELKRREKNDKNN